MHNRQVTQDEVPTPRASSPAAAALLTASDVGRMLGVDPTTIYRMAADGRLPAVKVGKQWRFRMADVAATFPGVSAAPVPPTAQPADPAPGQTGGPDGTGTPRPTAADPVPLALAESLIEVSARSLGVMMLVTDMTGRPLTAVANPCEWYLEHAGDPGVLETCVTEWRTLADDHDLSPRFVTGPLGFDCARAFVRRDSRLVAMVLAGGVSPAGSARSGLHHLDEPARGSVLDTLPRLAAVLARAGDPSTL